MLLEESMICKNCHKRGSTIRSKDKELVCEHCGMSRIEARDIEHRRKQIQQFKQEEKQK